MSDWQIGAWVSTYTAIAKGELATVSDDLQKLLERTPRPLQNSPKSPKCLGGNLGDFGEFCKGLSLKTANPVFRLLFCSANGGAV